jgi:hypothetical protein
MRVGTGDGEGHATATIDGHDRDPEAIAQLGVHAQFLEQVCEVQAWLGTPLFPPVRPTPTDAAEISRALSLIREPVHTGTWTRIDVREHEQEDYGDIAEAAILQPIELSVFGRTYYLGMQLVQVIDPVLEREPGGAQLRPGANDTVHVRLRHPHELPEEAASRYVGPGRGRVLIRPASPDHAAGSSQPPPAP